MNLWVRNMWRLTEQWQAEMMLAEEKWKVTNE